MFQVKFGSHLDIPMVENYSRDIIEKNAETLVPIWKKKGWPCDITEKWRFVYEF